MSAEVGLEESSPARTTLAGGGGRGAWARVALDDCPEGEPSRK